MPTAGIETLGVDEWLVTLLSADATLMAGCPGGVWNGEELEQGITFPVVQFFYSGGTDYGVVGQPSVLFEGTWTIKLVDDIPNYDRIRPLAKRMHTLLEKSSGVSSDTTVIDCHRETIVQYAPPSQGGQSERHLGGNYQIVATPL